MAGARLTPLLGPKSAGMWLVAAAAAALAVAAVQRPAVEALFAGNPIVLGTPMLHGGFRDNDAIVLECCGDLGQIDSMASWRVRIEPGRKYVIAATLANRGARDAAPLVVDLVGDAYDSMDQEFHVVVPAGASRVVARGVVPSGTPPDRVWLRIFHSNPTTVIVRDVSIRADGDSYGVLRGSALLALAGALIGLAVSGLATLRKRLAGLDWTSPGAARAWLSVAAVALAVAAVFNAMLGPPIVFADEYTYLSATAGTGGEAVEAMAGQDLPNRLFLALFGLAGTSLSPFVLARTLNVIALGLGFAALYLAANAANALGRGLVVAAAYGFGTLATYSAYFMPEVLYVALYLVTCAALAVALSTTGVLAGAIAGVACAALPFVKPHGWVAAGIFGLFTLLHVVRADPVERRRALRVGATIATAFAVSWLALDVALPDIDKRPALLGEMYGNVLTWVVNSAASPAAYGSIAKLIGAELVLVAALAAPALLFAGWALLRRCPLVGESTDRVACVLVEVSFVMLLALIAMTAVFTVSVVGVGPYEAANQLHWRYFNYALPLLVLGAAASTTAQAFFRRNFGVVLAVWATACIGAVILLPHFVWSFVGSPELFFGWDAPKATYAVFGAAAVMGSLLFRTVPDIVARTMVLAYLLVALIGGASVRQVQLSIGELPEHRAGRFASAMAEEARRPLLLLGDTGSLGLYRVASYLPRSARFVTPAEHARLAPGRLQPGAVVVGERDSVVQTGMVPVATFGPWAVAVLGPGAPAPEVAAQPRLVAPISISFAKSGSEALDARGLHAPEEWGAWSAEPQIAIVLPREVSGRLSVALRAHATAGNEGRKITMQVGGNSQEFVLKPTPTEVDFAFDVARPTRLVTIGGYRQLTSQEAKSKSDGRALGIGLWSLRIAQGAAPSR